MSKQTTKNKFADVDNAREETQKQVMQEILDADHCPFCTENLATYHQQETLRETDHWLLTTNQWPYQHTQLHLLLIYKEHVTNLAGINPKAGVELLKLAQWAEREYNIPGGGLAMRFGDTDYSAGTVAHLHAQLLVPDIHHPNYLDKPVRIKIGKTK